MYPRILGGIELADLNVQPTPPAPKPKRYIKVAILIKHTNHLSEYLSELAGAREEGGIISKLFRKSDLTHKKITLINDTLKKLKEDFISQLQAMRSFEYIEEFEAEKYLIDLVNLIHELDLAHNHDEVTAGAEHISIAQCRVKGYTFFESIFMRTTVQSGLQGVLEYCVNDINTTLRRIGSRKELPVAAKSPHVAEITNNKEVNTIMSAYVPMP